MDDAENGDIESRQTSDVVQGGDGIRYWSDFNRAYYAPRTVQKLPDPADWETTDGNWKSGQDAFSRFNEVTIRPDSVKNVI